MVRGKAFVTFLTAVTKYLAKKLMERKFHFGSQFTTIICPIRASIEAVN